MLVGFLTLVTTKGLGQTNDTIPKKNNVDTVVNTFKPLDSFINEWLGVRYKLGGSTKNGIDCSQFTKRLYKEVYGLSLENVAYRQWNQTVRILKSDLTIGDIIFFRSQSSPSGWHCGIYIGDNRFVHASNRYEGVKISWVTEPKYLKMYRGAGRIKQ